MSVCVSGRQSLVLVQDREERAACDCASQRLWWKRDLGQAPRCREPTEAKALESAPPGLELGSWTGWPQGYADSCGFRVLLAEAPGAFASCRSWFPDLDGLRLTPTPRSKK